MSPLAGRLLFAALGGAALGLGQVPWSLWPLGLLGLGCVLHLVAQAPTPRRAALVIFVAGFAHFALVLSWITQPFLVEPERYGWMAPFALVFMASGAAGFWALPVWAVRRWRAGLPALVLALCLSDLARGYVLTGFPWALFGHIWLDTPLAQVSALIGQTGLSFLTLAAAALAAGALRKRVLLAPALLVLALPWGYGAWRLAQPLPAPTGTVLRLVQPNLAQDAKWQQDLARQHFEALLAATSAPPRVDLVIWPETSLPYLLGPDSELPGIIAGAAGGAAVLFGYQRTEGARGWNSLAVLGPGGVFLAGYDKHHLVPFGEYLPLGDLLYDWFGISAFAAQAGRAYSAGPGPRVLDLGPLGKVLPLICYEAVFPQDLRTGGERAGWIVQITNDAWFGTRSGPFQHASLARLRALEQGLPLARIANTGVTQMIDARGRVTASLAFGSAGHLDAELPGALPATPYSRWGEGPLALLLAGLALWVIRTKPGRTA